MEKWVLYAIISMLFAGLTSVIAKFGMKDLNSDTALAVRTAVVFGIIIVNAFVFRNAYAELAQTPARNFIFLAISGLTTSLSWIFYYRAMKLGPVSYVASIDKASIVITLLLSFVILKEPITAKILMGGGLILAGMLVLVWK
jgi:bacterial/archaeal transporter family protein